MAICAPHLALVDFREDPLPTATSIRQCRDVGQLLADVIEFEHNDVGLTTVDARMVREVLDEMLLDSDPLLGDLAYEPRLLTFVILPIVPRVRLSETIAAPRLQLR